MKDHYVAQTYLEAFTNSKGMLVPYYKAENVVLGKPKSPKSICFETDGDTNKYFNDPRILDKYLPQFENPWKQNVETLRERHLDGMVKYQIAGYLAFLRCCTPAAKRLGQERIRATIQPTVQSVLEHQFKIDPPASKEAREIIETLIEKKQITTEIDRQFPHALGISHLLSIASRFLSGRWLIMINKSDRPFITSDNPAVAYYHSGDVAMAQVYIPIAPDIALMIAGDPGTKSIDAGFINNSLYSKDRFAVPRIHYIDKFNELIIQAAEKYVIHHMVDKEFEQKVRENAAWCMKIVVDNIPAERGTIVVTRELTRKREGRESTRFFTKSKMARRGLKNSEGRRKTTMDNGT